MRPVKPSEVLRKSKAPVFLVTDLINVRYLTGLEMSFGVILIKPKSWTVYTDPRYLEAAEKNCLPGFRIKNISTFASDMKNVVQCGFESDCVSVSQFNGWKKKFSKTKFVPETGIIQEFRRSKDADELRKFKKSQAITVALMQKIAKHLKAGMSEKEMAWNIRRWAHEAGAEDLSFDPIVAFGSNTARPHHHPTKKKLRHRDIVQIDCGVVYQGYCSDRSEVFFVGEPTKKQRHIYDLLFRIKNEAVGMVSAGVTNNELDRYVRGELKRESVEEYFTHSLGHGVGLEVHEGVSLSVKAKTKELVKNEIVTIEPGLYFPGKFGMRLEEEVVVT